MPYYSHNRIIHIHLPLHLKSVTFQEYEFTTLSLDRRTRSSHNVFLIWAEYSVCLRVQCGHPTVYCERLLERAYIPY